MFSLCMSLRRVPNITYSTVSKTGQKIAERLSSRLEREYTQNHKDFLQENLELLIFDRKEDPITPLIYNWSYVPLVNEFIGIESNSVKLNGKLEVFSRQSDDSFLDKNCHKNFGEFTLDLSQQLEKLEKDKSGARIESLTEMQNALDKIGDKSKEVTQMKKHSEIYRIVNESIQGGDIYGVSQLQQDIITDNNKTGQFKDLLNMLAKKNVTSLDKLKLVMLYCLKYHDDVERVNGLQRAIAAQNLPSGVVNTILEYASINKRNTSELFSVNDILEKVSVNIFSKLRVDT